MRQVLSWFDSLSLSALFCTEGTPSDKSLEDEIKSRIRYSSQLVSAVRKGVPMHIFVQTVGDLVHEASDAQFAKGLVALEGRCRVIDEARGHHLAVAEESLTLPSLR